MRPPGKARRGSKPGVCDRRVTQPGEMQRRPNAEVFRDHCTSCGSHSTESGRDAQERLSLPVTNTPQVKGRP